MESVTFLLGSPRTRWKDSSRCSSVAKLYLRTHLDFVNSLVESVVICLARNQKKIRLLMLTMVMVLAQDPTESFLQLNVKHHGQLKGSPFKVFV